MKKNYKKIASKRVVSKRSSHRPSLTQAQDTTIRPARVVRAPWVAVLVCAAAVNAWAIPVGGNGNETALRLKSQAVPVAIDPKPQQPVKVANMLRNTEVDESAGATPAYVMGDHIKIAFYEHMDLQDDAAHTDKISPPQGLVERSELTGEYVVQQGGEVVLPIIGAVSIEGKSNTDAQAALESAFRSALHRDASVSLTITEREPVYVIGRGWKTGTFKYSPGMTVLHAIALAGGVDEDHSDVYLRAEEFREREKLEKSTQQLKLLLAKSAVLHAERDHARLETPAALIQLVGSEEGNRLVESAAQMRALIVASSRPQILSAQAEIAVAQKEVENCTKRLAIIRSHSKVQDHRREMVESIKDKMSATPFTYYQVQAEVADIQEREQEASTALAQADTHVAKAQQDLNKLETDFKLDLEKDILATDADAAEQSASVSGSQRFISELRIKTFRMITPDKDAAFEIVRRTRQGSVRIAATENTDLVPGDLVQIVSGHESLVKQTRLEKDQTVLQNNAN